MKKRKDYSIAFFGTSSFAVTILRELEERRFSPALIVTGEDKPHGRGQKVLPPPVKIWAEERRIDVIQPKHLKEVPDELFNTDWDVFILASYGKLIPRDILDLPAHGILNVHPSLLPKFRGPSPIESAILADENETGVTIMLLDEEMDHGPIVAQARVELDRDEGEWPPQEPLLEDLLAHVGGELLAEMLPSWIRGELTPETQNHDAATYTKKIQKEDGFIDLSDDPYQNFLKIQAYRGWPGTYFFTTKGNKKIRVKIADAEYEHGALAISRVIPEGKKEMDYEDFLRGNV